MNVLIVPIKPVFAYRIFTGRKKYDLRRTAKRSIPVKTGDRAVLYVTGRVKAFMGEYTVGRIIIGTPEYIVKALSRNPNSGVGEEDFNYIKGAERALAMEVLRPVIYKKPVDMREVLRIFPDYRPPLGIQKLDEYEPVVVLVFNKARSLTTRLRA